MKTNPVGWFEIYVQDMPRARAFYAQVFETVLEKFPLEQPEMWGFAMNMASHGTAGALVKAEGVPSGPGGTLVYFSCVDCAVEESRVVPAGGEVVRAKMSIGEYGFISLVKDSEGNLIGLHSRQ